MSKEIDTNTHTQQNQEDYRERFTEQRHFEHATTRFE